MLSRDYFHVCLHKTSPSAVTVDFTVKHEIKMDLRVYNTLCCDIGLYGVLMMVIFHMTVVANAELE